MDLTYVSNYRKRALKACVSNKPQPFCFKTECHKNGTVSHTLYRSYLKNDFILRIQLTQNNFKKISDISFKIQVLKGQNHLSSDPLWLFPKNKKSSQSSLALSISFTATFFCHSKQQSTVWKIFERLKKSAERFCLNC